MPDNDPAEDDMRVRCVHCGFVGSIQVFDVGGLDDSELYCNQCGRLTPNELFEDHNPAEVAALREQLSQWQRRAGFNRSVALSGETWTQEAENEAADQTKGGA